MQLRARYMHYVDTMSILRYRSTGSNSAQARLVERDASDMPAFKGDVRASEAKVTIFARTTREAGCKRCETT